MCADPGRGWRIIQAGEIITSYKNVFLSHLAVCVLDMRGRVNDSITVRVKYPYNNGRGDGPCEQAEIKAEGTWSK